MNSISRIKRVDLSKVGVLVVDDELIMLRLVNQILRELGVRHVFTEADGENAMNTFSFARHEIDVIICDWNMPKMSGLDVLKKIRVVHGDIPFLMLTGRTDAGSVKMAGELGVGGYVRKPFAPTDLVKQFLALLRRYRIGMS